MTLASRISDLATSIAGQIKTLTSNALRVQSVSVSTTSTLTTVNRIYSVTTSASAIVLTLPAAGTVGDVIELYKVDTGTGTVAVTGLGTLMGAGRNECLFRQGDWVRFWWNGSNWMPLMWKVRPVYDVWATPGSYSWYKYPLGLTYTVEGCGGGGGGYSGSTAVAMTAAPGGSAGGSASYHREVTDASTLPNTALAIVTGASGTAGVAVTASSTAGTAGGSGGNTSIGTTSTTAYYFIAKGGSNLGFSLSGSLNMYRSNVVAALATGLQASSSLSGQEIQALPGSGSGVDMTNAHYAGTSGRGTMGGATSAGSAGVGGTAGGGAGGDGAAFTTSNLTTNWWYGSAPGGGGGNNAGNGGKGGNAILVGCGGGGGGGCRNTYTSGAGGTGGPGYLQIRTDF